MEDHSKGAASHLRGLMARELSNQFARLYPGNPRSGWPDTCEGSVPGIRVASPGIVEILLPETSPREASFFAVIEHLALACNAAGDAGLDKMPTPGKGDRRILPYPANSPSHLQIGDVIPPATGYPWSRSATVRAIHLSQDGRTRAVLAAPRLSDAVVELDWPGGGRVGMEAAALPPLGSAPSGARQAMPHLKRLSAQAGRLLSNQVRSVRAGGGWDRRILDLCAMRSATKRLTEETASPPQDAGSAELAFLRLRRRDVRTLSDDLARPFERIVGKPALMAMVAKDDASLSNMIASKFERSGRRPSR